MDSPKPAASARPPSRSRRGHGEGSWFQRPDGSWKHQFTLPDGKRRSVYGKTKKECLDKRKVTEQRFAQGLTALGKSQTVEQFLTYWLADVAKATIRGSTYERNESCVRVHILPQLGKVKLANLTGQQIQVFYGRLGAGGLKPASVIRVHSVLHRALRMAVRWKLIASNPADDVDKPQVARTEMQYLSRDQVAKLFEQTRDPLFHALYVLAATVGLRRGELLGLRWSDIDFERGTLSIQRTAKRLKDDGIVFGEPKTAASLRTVTLSEVTKQALRAWRHHQREQRLRAGPAWKDQGLVFTSGVGTPLEEARVTRAFQRDLRNAGLPKVRVHDLRHTFATLQIEGGTPMLSVQRALGHSTIGTTADVYAHFTPAMQDAVADTMDRLFGAGGS